MSILTLSKLYGDTELLYKSDIDTLLSELEAKTNGMLDSSNVTSGWGNLNEVTLAKDISFTFGTTDSAYTLYENTTHELNFGNTAAGKATIFKVGGTEVARIDSTSNDFIIKTDVVFQSRSAVSIYRLIGSYQKPVLVYINSTTIDVENNSTTANETIIAFPTGPIAVTEDTSSTNKFRRLGLAATANGYGATHTGAADSGLRTGLSLSANTWYFVYAVRVQYGDDAGNKFILVVDDTSPAYSNETTLNSRYGSSEWIYLGTIRRGYGGTATTTLVAFQQEHQGWTYFIDRGASNDYFGVQVASTSVTSTSEVAKWTMGISNSGNNLPANVSAVKVDTMCIDDGDGDFELMFNFVASSGDKLSYLQHIESDGEQMGIQWHLPVISGAYIGVRRQVDESTNDADLEIYVTGFLDHYV